MSDLDLDELADELSEFAAPEKETGRAPRDERVIAGFEDIQRFYETHKRLPQHGDDGDIFERLYAVRLERIRAQEDLCALLAPFDHQGLLSSGLAEPATEYTVDELESELVSGTDDVRVLRYVRTSAEKRAAEEIADRKRCEDFETFKPLFERAEAEVKAGLRQSAPIEAGRRGVEAGDFFVLGGITLYVAAVGEPIKTTGGEPDSRLRLIFGNGTESNLLVRSLQRAFYNDPAARRLLPTASGQLSFGGEMGTDDIESGTIYVLRSQSDHPFVAQHRELVHKIGVTGGSVESRIANAASESTFLRAKVDVVATYKLAGINRSKLEKLFHRLFGAARLDITIPDQTGTPVQPQEWFLVPFFNIEEAVQRIKDGTIVNVVYDPKEAKFVDAPVKGRKK